ncbi:PREDICTED: epididymal secretory protein E1-like [Branchiostoma belcheri]|uniref:NPC intracellular cholesterol transporter 2 n=1 Tax=Branchiostoma belcheri TaxID=7741 RepID=A0A6P4YZL3_BRABE|nr:PREDICTED: epididymal secretory protein E1-like [Branchiostoma belcheri]
MVTRAVFIIAFVASVAVADPAQYLDCGSSAKLHSVDVTPCPASVTCGLIRGENASIAVTFTTEKVANSVVAVVHAIVAGVPLPFPLPNPDGCQDSGLECPLNSSTTYTHTTILPVKSGYPMTI